MPVTRRLFWGIPAFIGKAESDTTSYFWCQPEPLTPGESALIKLDFTKRPSLTGLALAEIDDFDNTGKINGLTELRPFPYGPFYGAVYCNESLKDICKGMNTGWNPDTPSEYTMIEGELACQYQCLVEDDGSSAGVRTRFHGFRVKLLTRDLANKNKVTLDIYRWGLDAPQKRLVVHLNDKNECHPYLGTDSYSKISDTTPDGTMCELFLNMSFVSTNTLAIPKLPPSLGS